MPNITHVVTGATWPSTAPPSVGAHYIMVDADENPTGSLWFAVAAEQPEDWVLVKGNAKGLYADINHVSATQAVDRMTRLVSLSVGFDLEGTQALAVVELPDSPVIREDLVLEVLAINGRSVTARVDVKFPYPIGGITMPDGAEGVTAAVGEDFLRLTVTQDIRLTFKGIEYVAEGGDPTVAYATVVPSDPGPTQWVGVPPLS